MGQFTIEERVQQLRWAGYNPIHLWGNVYLVRTTPTSSEYVPFYKIEIFKD